MTQPLFELADRVQLVLCPLAILIIVIQGMSGLLNHRRVSHWIRLIAIAVAAIFLITRYEFVNPPMNSHLDAYRAAVRTGDLETATSEYAIFDGWHHTAERLWGLTAVCLIISIGATGVTLAPSPRQSS